MFMWFTDLNKGMLNHRPKEADRRLHIYIYIIYTLFTTTSTIIPPGAVDVVPRSRPVVAGASSPYIEFAYAQRVKALEQQARGVHWSVARQLELVSADAAGLRQGPKSAEAAKNAREELRNRLASQRP